jgi:hypothetical protein
VAQITIHQGGKTRQMIHNGPGKWSLAAGSQGFIESKYIEQAVQEFHQLTAWRFWVGHNYTDPGQYGFATNNLQITFELKNGATDMVDFGAEYPQKQTGLGAVALDGDRWAFFFEPAAYQLALSYFTIPANVP